MQKYPHQDSGFGEHEICTMTYRYGAGSKLALGR